MSPNVVNPVPRTYVRGFRACPSGTSEHSSLHLRTGRSVVRGKGGRQGVKHPAPCHSGRGFTPFHLSSHRPGFDPDPSTLLRVMLKDSNHEAQTRRELGPPVESLKVERQNALSVSAGMNVLKFPKGKPQSHGRKSVVRGLPWIGNSPLV